jgi:hypothetical protein
VLTNRSEQFLAQIIFFVARLQVPLGSFERKKMNRTANKAEKHPPKSYNTCIIKKKEKNKQTHKKKTQEYFCRKNFQAGKKSLFGTKPWIAQADHHRRRKHDQWDSMKAM